MITKMQTYLVTCDGCQKEIIMHDFFGTSLPKGWKSLSVGKRDEMGRDVREFCKECAEKHTPCACKCPPVMEDGDEARKWLGVSR